MTPATPQTTWRKRRIEVKVLSIDRHKHAGATCKGRTAAGKIVTMPLANVLHLGPPRIGEWVEFLIDFGKVPT